MTSRRRPRMYHALKELSDGTLLLYVGRNELYGARSTRSAATRGSLMAHGASSTSSSTYRTIRRTSPSCRRRCSIGTCRRRDGGMGWHVVLPTRGRLWPTTIRVVVR